MDLSYWGPIAAVVGAIIAIGGVVVRLVDRINKTDSKANAAQIAADSAKASGTAANRRIDDLDKEFRAHQVHIAEQYASNDELREMRREILGAIGDLGKRVDQAIAGRT